MLNVAILGWGNAARTFHAPLIAATPGLRLVRAAVRSPASVEAVRAAGVEPGDLEAVLADPAVDLVIVATPSRDHGVHALRTLAAGKHVVVDKPMAASVGEAEAMVEAATRAARLLGVFHNRRWDADFLSLRAVLDSGVLGELVELTSAWDRFRPTVLDRWRDRPEPGAGLWFDLGAHLVDQALHLFGQPAKIEADIAAERPGAQAADRFNVRLRYANGLRVVLEARSVAMAPAPRFVAHGTRGSFVKHGLDPQEAALMAGARPGEGAWGVDPQPGVLTVLGEHGPETRPAPDLRGDYRAFYAGLRDAIREGAPLPVTGEEGLAVVRLLETAASGSR